MLEQIRVTIVILIAERIEVLRGEGACDGSAAVGRREHAGFSERGWRRRDAEAEIEGEIGVEVIHVIAGGLEAGFCRLIAMREVELAGVDAGGGRIRAVDAVFDGQIVIAFAIEGISSGGEQSFERRAAGEVQRGDVNEVITDLRRVQAIGAVRSGDGGGHGREIQRVFRIIADAVQTQRDAADRGVAAVEDAVVVHVLEDEVADAQRIHAEAEVDGEIAVRVIAVVILIMRAGFAAGGERLVATREREDGRARAIDGDDASGVAVLAGIVIIRADHRLIADRWERRAVIRQSAGGEIDRGNVKVVSARRALELIQTGGIRERAAGERGAGGVPQLQGDARHAELAAVENAVVVEVFEDEIAERDVRDEAEVAREVDVGVVGVIAIAFKAGFVRASGRGARAEGEVRAAHADKEVRAVVDAVFAAVVITALHAAKAGVSGERRAGGKLVRRDEKEVSALRQAGEEVGALVVGEGGHHRRIAERIIAAFKELHGHVGDALAAVARAVVVRIDEDAVADAEWQEEAEIDGEIAVVVVRVVEFGAQTGFTERIERLCIDGELNVHGADALQLRQEGIDAVFILMIIERGIRAVPWQGDRACERAGQHRIKHGGRNEDEVGARGEAGELVDAAVLRHERLLRRIGERIIARAEKLHGDAVDALAGVGAAVGVEIAEDEVAEIQHGGLRHGEAEVDGEVKVVVIFAVEVFEGTGFAAAGDGLGIDGQSDARGGDAGIGGSERVHTIVTGGLVVIATAGGVIRAGE